MGGTMTPERWKQVEALYHSARERGVGVLSDTDPDLRREVERLLSQDSEGKILDRGAQDLLDEFKTTVGQSGFAGQTISHYNVQEEIGAGGMGVVYKALDTRLGRLVALKFLPPGLSHNTEFRRRLNDEARAASGLDHPNIVVIHDIGETPTGDVFIAMAFHEGVTLREKIASGIEAPEALRIARQIASGLAKAHEHGIFHRDIKPGNIIVAKDGTARIIDFGLARSSDVTATMDGAARGTPLYMSPEQATGKAVDFRTDLWSLGAVLYEMLAGRPAFRGDSQLQVMRAVVNDEPPALRDIRPDLPLEIDAIVRRALKKDAPARYPSAAVMGDDLADALAALEMTPGRSGLRSAYAIPAAVLIVLAAGLSFWFYQRSEKRHWAHEQPPKIGEFVRENKPLAAFRLLQKAQQYLPGDPELAQVRAGLAHEVAVRSTPVGASVEIQDYLTPNGPWYALGATPLDHIKIPNGYLRWRVSKPGMKEFVNAPLTETIEGFVREFNFPLDAIAAAPEGMVPVPAQKYFTVIWSLGDFGPYDLPQFYIDRYEVTNRQYQEFVDKGGYRKRD